LRAGDEATEDIYDGKNTKAARRFPKSIWAVARRKLDMLDAAGDLKDMAVPPSNKLEKLLGDLAGYYSVRVNDQFRLIFQFDQGQASEVRLIDYH
jgi:toxin HigB-1